MNMRMQFFKEKHNDMRAYFLGARREISNANLNTLSVATIVTAIITILFILGSGVLFPNFEVTPYHVMLGILMVIYAGISHIFKRNIIHVHMKAVKAACAVYVITLMVLLSIMDTILYPEYAQTFVAVLIVVTPIIFIVTFWEMIIFQLGFLVLYSAMTIEFKGGMIARNDIFAMMLGFVVGVAIYIVVTNVRCHDYIQRIAYKHSSELDMLTGISNRAKCKKQIEQYLLRKQDNNKCAMIVLDVDNFKQVNDEMGHEKGDEVLRGVAEILQNVFRNTDIIGRFGGDEFVIFMKDIKDDETIRVKCKAINQKMSELMDGTNAFSCSMGVCTCMEQEVMFEELFRIADEALYEAKDFGKATYVKHDYERNLSKHTQMPLMLIVDDMMIDRDTIAVQFEEKFRIIKFEDGATTLQYVREHAEEIDIILLDMIMPGIQGYEVLKILKADPATGWIPIIAVSSDENAEEAALQYGADDMIVKPVVPSIVKLRVENVMKKMRRSGRRTFK